MAKPTVSARVEEGTYEDFEEFVEENGMSKAEALRLLLRDGLEANEQDIEKELREIRDKIPRTDGGRAASAREVQRLQEQQNRQQRASMWQNVGLGSGILYLAGLTFFSPPTSAVLIFGVLISVVILYSVYRLSEFIDINGTSIESPTSEDGQ
jgi:antitoxin component of RelBE/YafQ-DinJ toxin-antitoxin module